HLVVIWSQWRDLQMIRQFHGRDSWRSRQAAQSRFASRVFDDVFVDCGERLDIVRADIENLGSWIIECQNAGVREVLCVYELIDVPPASHRPNAAAIVDELEEDREQAQSSAIHDRGAADDNRV